MEMQKAHIMLAYLLTAAHVLSGISQFLSIDEDFRNRCNRLFTCFTKGRLLMMKSLRKWVQIAVFELFEKVLSICWKYWICRKWNEIWSVAVLSVFADLESAVYCLTQPQECLSFLGWETGSLWDCNNWRQLHFKETHWRNSVFILLPFKRVTWNLMEFLQVEKSGYLIQMTDSRLKSLKRRYFILKDSSLSL